MSEFGKIKKRNYQEVENPLDEIFFSRKTEEVLEKNEESWQYKIWWSLIFIVLLFFFGRTFYLQVIKGSYYQERAEQNRIRHIVIKAQRGIIKDTEGTIIASNAPGFELTFVPAYLPKSPEKRREILLQISGVTGKSLNDLEKKIEAYDPDDQRAHLLIAKLKNEEALKLIEILNSAFGIVVNSQAYRQYPKGKIIANLIGYDGKVSQNDLKKHPDYLLIDHIGKSGLEKFYEKYLRGKHGEDRYEVDAQGKIIQHLGKINPVLGDELILNIDIKLQEKIYSEAEKIMLENKDATGIAVVAINPRDGGVRAMVSYPGYDNNLFVKGIKDQKYRELLSDKAQPLLNKTISGLYPPGSTFKPLVALAGLEENVINEHTHINCPGGISIGQWQFPDWKTHGITDVKKAIAESCDVFFYSVGGGWESIKGLGVNKIKKYAEFFGLGDRLGIDIPGEKKGILPDNIWKFKKLGEKWYVGDTYHLSIGQGYLLVTPLQMANLTATIANGGIVYEPHIVRQIKGADGKIKKTIKKKVLNKNFIKERNIQIVQEGMRQTVTDGSGRLLNDLKVTTAGKTGTAQFGTEGKTHSWYISYAPYENPELAMVVLVMGGGEGHSWAVPLTKEIYKWYFDEKRGELTKEEKVKEVQPDDIGKMENGTKVDETEVLGNAESRF